MLSLGHVSVVHVCRTTSEAIGACCSKDGALDEILQGIAVENNNLTCTAALISGREVFDIIGCRPSFVDFFTPALACVQGHMLAVETRCGREALFDRLRTGFLMGTCSACYLDRSLCCMRPSMLVVQLRRCCLNVRSRPTPMAFSTLTFVTLIVPETEPLPWQYADILASLRVIDTSQHRNSKTSKAMQIKKIIPGFEICPLTPPCAKLLYSAVHPSCKCFVFNPSSSNDLEQASAELINVLVSAASTTLLPATMKYPGHNGRSLTNLKELQDMLASEQKILKRASASTKSKTERVKSTNATRLYKATEAAKNDSLERVSLFVEGLQTYSSILDQEAGRNVPYDPRIPARVFCEHADRAGLSVLDRWVCHSQILDVPVLVPLGPFGQGWNLSNPILQYKIPGGLTRVICGSARVPDDDHLGGLHLHLHDLTFSSSTVDVVMQINYTGDGVYVRSVLESVPVYVDRQFISPGSWCKLEHQVRLTLGVVPRLSCFQFFCHSNTAIDESLNTGIDTMSLVSEADVRVLCSTRAMCVDPGTLNADVIRAVSASRLICRSLQWLLNERVLCDITVTPVAQCVFKITSKQLSGDPCCWSISFRSVEDRMLALQALCNTVVGACSECSTTVASTPAHVALLEGVLTTSDSSVSRTLTDAESTSMHKESVRVAQMVRFFVQNGLTDESICTDKDTFRVLLTGKCRSLLTAEICDGANLGISRKTLTTAEAESAILKRLMVLSIKYAFDKPSSTQVTERESVQLNSSSAASDTTITVLMPQLKPASSPTLASPTSTLHPRLPHDKRAHVDTAMPPEYSDPFLIKQVSEDHAISAQHSPHNSWPSTYTPNQFSQNSRSSNQSEDGFHSTHDRSSEVKQPVAKDKELQVDNYDTCTQMQEPGGEMQMRLGHASPRSLWPDTYTPTPHYAESDPSHTDRGSKVLPMQSPILQGPVVPQRQRESAPLYQPGECEEEIFTGQTSPRSLWSGTYTPTTDYKESFPCQASRAPNKVLPLQSPARQKHMPRDEVAGFLHTTNHLHHVEIRSPLYQASRYRNETQRHYYELNTSSRPLDVQVQIYEPLNVEEVEGFKLADPLDREAKLMMLVLSLRKSFGEQAKIRRTKFFFKWAKNIQLSRLQSQLLNVTAELHETQAQVVELEEAIGTADAMQYQQERFNSLNTEAESLRTAHRDAAEIMKQQELQIAEMYQDNVRVRTAYSLNTEVTKKQELQIAQLQGDNFRVRTAYAEIAEVMNQKELQIAQLQKDNMGLRAAYNETVELMRQQELRIAQLREENLRLEANYGQVNGTLRLEKELRAQFQDKASCQWETFSSLQLKTKEKAAFFMTRQFRRIELRLAFQHFQKLRLQVTPEVLYLLKSLNECVRSYARLISRPAYNDPLDVLVDDVSPDENVKRVVAEAGMLTIVEDATASKRLELFMMQVQKQVFDLGEALASMNDIQSHARKKLQDRVAELEDSARSSQSQMKRLLASPVLPNSSPTRTTSPSPIHQYQSRRESNGMGWNVDLSLTSATPTHKPVRSCRGQQRFQRLEIKMTVDSSAVLELISLKFGPLVRNFVVHKCSNSNPGGWETVLAELVVYLNCDKSGLDARDTSLLFERESFLQMVVPGDGALACLAETLLVRAFVLNYTVDESASPRHGAVDPKGCYLTWERTIRMLGDLNLLQHSNPHAEVNGSDEGSLESAEHSRGFLTLSLATRKDVEGLFRRYSRQDYEVNFGALSPRLIRGVKSRSRKAHNAALWSLAPRSDDSAGSGDESLRRRTADKTPNHNNIPTPSPDLAQTGGGWVLPAGADVKLLVMLAMSTYSEMSARSAWVTMLQKHVIPRMSAHQNEIHATRVCNNLELSLEAADCDLDGVMLQNQSVLWQIFSFYCPDRQDVLEDSNTHGHASAKFRRSLLPLEDLMKLLKDFGLCPTLLRSRGVQAMFEKLVTGSNRLSFFGFTRLLTDFAVNYTGNFCDPDTSSASRLCIVLGIMSSSGGPAKLKSSGCMLKNTHALFILPQNK